MSSAQEYKYTITVDPNDLNKLEEYVKKLDQIGSKPETEGGPSATLETQDMDTIMTAIRGITTNYSHTTYKYDDEKVNQILKIVGDTRNLTLALFSRIGGFRMEDDLEDLKNQVNDMSEIDLFKISQNLSELEASIRSGGTDTRIARDNAVERGESAMKFSLSNEAIQQLSNRVVQYDIRDRIDQITESPQEAFDRAFRERSQMLLADNITEMIKSQQEADKLRSELEKVGGKLDDLDRRIQGTEDISEIIRINKEREEAEAYARKVGEGIKEWEKRQSEKGKSVLGSLNYVERKGPDVLQADLISVGVTDPSLIKQLQDMYVEYVRDIKKQPSRLQGEKDPITALYQSFLDMVKGQAPNERENESTYNRIRELVGGRVQSNIDNYESATTDFDRGVALSSSFPSVAGYLSQGQAERPSPRQSAIGTQMQQISQMMNRATIGIKAVMTEINNQIERGTESQTRTEDNSNDLREIYRHMEEMTSSISESVDKVVEMLENKDDTTETRVT